MTFKDLILNGLIKDSDCVTIAKPLTGSACDIRGGKWFNDQVLEYMNTEIKALSWEEDSGWSIALK